MLYKPKNLFGINIEFFNQIYLNCIAKHINRLNFFNCKI